MSLVYVEEVFNIEEISNPRIISPAPAAGERYSCKIVIPSSDWERLETGPYKKYDVLTPYVSWCHKHIGQGWGLYHSVGFDEVYFMKKDDAMRFRLMWG